MTAIVIGAVLFSPSALAAPPANGGSISVPRDFPTIQAAVDAAAPGATITIGRGTYIEEIVIDRDLNLRGAGAGTTVIKAPASLTSYGVHLPDGRGLTAIVRVGHGANARISGLTVEGPIPCGVEVTGIQALQAATLEPTDARVTGIQADPTTCAPEDAAGRAVVFGTPPHVVVDGEHGTTAYGHVAHVTVDHYQHVGLTATGPSDGPPSVVAFTDDVVTGGWIIPSFQVGVWGQ